MAGSSVGSKKLQHAVNQVRPLQLTGQSIVMLGPLLDTLIQFTYFHVDVLGNIKAKRHLNARQTMFYRIARTQNMYTAQWLSCIVLSFSQGLSMEENNLIFQIS